MVDAKYLRRFLTVAAGHNNGGNAELPAGFLASFMILSEGNSHALCYKAEEIEAQIFPAHIFTVAAQNGPLDGVLELADIPRPMASMKQFQHFG